MDDYCVIPDIILRPWSECSYLVNGCVCSLDFCPCYFFYLNCSLSELDDIK